MEGRDTEYRWLRFVAGLYVVLGVLSLLAGAAGLAFAVLALLRVAQVPLDVWAWGLWSVVLLLSGIVTIGFGQGIRALADIADNSRLIPLLLDRMTQPRNTGRLSGLTRISPLHACVLPDAGPPRSHPPDRLVKPPSRMSSSRRKSTWLARCTTRCSVQSSPPVARASAAASSRASRQARHRYGVAFL